MKMRIGKSLARRVFDIMLAGLVVFGLNCIFDFMGQRAYADDSLYMTQEEFLASLEPIREDLKTLEKQLAEFRAYLGDDSYQELWDLLGRYAETEESLSWGGDTILKEMPIGYRYDAVLYEELVAKLQEAVPGFQPEENVVVEDVPTNNIVSSVMGISNPEIAITGYGILQVGHLKYVLGRTQEVFDRYVHADGLVGNHVTNKMKKMATQQGYSGETMDYISVAGLYNRIQEKEVFAEAWRILENARRADWHKLLNALSLLQHAEQMTTLRYYPVVSIGLKKLYFGRSVAESLGDTYTLAQLVEYLPSHTNWSKIDKEETIAKFESILAAETENLREALIAINPKLGDLDVKTLDELIELGNKTVEYQGLNRAGKEMKTEFLASLLAAFEVDVLGQGDEYPADKYFIETSAVALADETGKISYGDLLDSGASFETIWKYYGWIGRVALALDQEVTSGLKPHPDWALLNIHDEDEEDDTGNSGTISDANDGETDTAKDGQGIDTGNIGLAPSTGVLSNVDTGVTTMGVVGVFGMVLVIGLVVRKRMRSYSIK